jgi:phosphoribosyl 1,2-cyclic phosphate phosphodiesterase
MQLRFLGTGTSMGVPVIGCRCPVCTSPDSRNRRTRTSALVRTADRQIVIDAGPDFRTQALAAGLSRIDAVLITHAHFDHVAGLDDLRPLTMYGDPMPIYGSTATLAAIRERFAYAFDTNASDGSTRPGLDLYPVAASFAIGATTITPFDILHGTWSITGYRMGGLAYVTDASTLPPAAWSHLEHVDVLVLNALRQTPHPTHLSIPEALDVIERIQPRQAYLVHMNHSVEHIATQAELPPNVFLAYDGLEVEVTD